jgi:hypothetical protein
METKAVGTVSTVLRGLAILLLFAAAFDVTPVSDNMMIFLALACFVVSGVINRIAKGACCCK